jgi:hypothetical protein
MFYRVMAWRVDIDQLKSYYGSRDEALLEEILKDPDIAERIAEDDAENEKKIAGGTPSLAQALRNIIMGDSRACFCASDERLRFVRAGSLDGNPVDFGPGVRKIPQEAAKIRRA